MRSTAHSTGAYLPENFIQSFFDLVIWGHEHECLIDPVYNAEQEFYVTQPGSSVATSLSRGETVPKYLSIAILQHIPYRFCFCLPCDLFSFICGVRSDFRHVGLLSVTGREFHMEKIRLKTVRPFVMRDIVLSEVPRFAKKASDKGKEAVIAYLREQVTTPYAPTYPFSAFTPPISRFSSRFS